MPLSMQFSLASSPSPLLPHDSLLLHQLRIQGGHLHSICQLSHLVRGLHLLKSNEKVIEALSALFFWDQFKL